ncbi:secretion system protein [Hydrogenovibrio sp. SC-1]|nr:secretion system protein [Hydrogenovibrio sp. SC-1]
MTSYFRGLMQEDFSLLFAKFQFKRDAKTRKRIWEKLIVLIQNEVQILQALEALRDRTKRMKGKNHYVVIALESWIRGVNEGRFVNAVKPWINDDEAMLLVSGYESGKLENALESITTIMDGKAKIKKAIVSGLSYPAFLILALVGALNLFGNEVIPAFMEIAPDAHWSGLAAVSVDLSHFAQQYLNSILMGFALLIIVFFISLPKWNSELRVYLDKYPPFSIYRTTQGASFLIAFSAFVQSGVKVKDALHKLKESANPWLKERIQATLIGINSGKSVGDALLDAGHDFPDREVIDDLGIYSNLSGFEDALRKIGETWLDTAIEQVQSNMKVIFVIGLVFSGIVISILIGGVFSLQEQLQDALQ